MENFKSWFPTAFCSRKGASPHYSKPFAVIVLNQPIENREVFISVCSRAVQRVCADGGANRVKDLDLVGLDEESCVCLPLVELVTAYVNALRDQTSLPETWTLYNQTLRNITNS